MNALRIVSYVSYRTFAKRITNVDIQDKLQIRKISNLNCDIKGRNKDDLDKFEVKHTIADKSYDIHNEEEYSEEELKNNIDQRYLDKKKTNECNNEVSQDGENNISTNVLDNENSMNDKQMIMQNKDSLQKNKSKKKLTLHEFVRRRLPKLYETCPEKAITLLHEYDKYIKSTLQDGKESIPETNLNNNNKSNISTNTLDNENSMNDKQMFGKADLLNKNISNN